MMRFKPKAEHVPVKELVVADTVTLSRNPLVNVTEASGSEEDVKTYVVAGMMSQPASLEKLEQIKQATLFDPQLTLVLNYTINGWPKYAKDVQEQIRQYYTVRGVLSVVNGKIIYCNRTVVPSALQSEVLDRHQV